MVDMNFVVPKNLSEVIQVLERRIEVHQQWAEYLEANMQEQYAKDAVAIGIGTAENHRLYIDQYRAAIRLITESYK